MMGWSEDFETDESLPPEPIRAGFGRGLRAAGAADERIVALCADLTTSTQMNLFRDEFPERFIQVGVAEQNLVTVASGLAATGKIPFATSYAAFSPGRNWEQIRTTICLNEMPVKVVGSHAGLNVGPDGATHQMLEDLALMRVLPHMTVVAPGDSFEAELATRAIAQHPGPCYLRLVRDATRRISREGHTFTIGAAYVVKTGTDVTMCATGTSTGQVMGAVEEIERACGMSIEVIHVPTVKPLDEETLLRSAAKTSVVITVEEAQAAGGFGSAVAELMASKGRTKVLRLGVQDRYGESGSPADLLRAHRLDSAGIAQTVRELVDREDIVVASRRF